MKQTTDSSEDQVNLLLRVAEYFKKPQQFMAVADARAEMRRMLELAGKGSVVLTNHGEPEAAVVSFATLEDMRRALVHLLIQEMQASFARTHRRLEARWDELTPSTEAEIEKMVGEALRKARHKHKSVPRVRRG